MIRKISVLLCASLILILAGCSQTARVQLKAGIDEANKSCPVVLSEDITMVGFSYDDDDNDVVVTYAYSETYGDVGIIAAAKESQKRFMKNYLISDTGRIFYDQILKADAGLRLVFRGSQSNESIDIYFSPDELKSFDKPQTEDNAMEQIKAIVDISNSQTPVHIDGDDLIMTSVELEGNYMVFNYIYNTAEYDFNNVDTAELTQEQTVALAEELNSNAGRQQKALMQQLGLGVKYRFIPDDGSRGIETFIAPEEVQSM